MKSICVFCGSKTGLNKSYTQAAIALGKKLVAENITLVFGGGSVGLMGVVADTVMATGGNVIGVIPEKLQEMEVAHHGISDLIVVENMHQRKAKMYELSDAFVALPGGMGTLDELCEIFTWMQIGYHQKPIALLNQSGFFEGLMQHMQHSVHEGFLSQKHFEWLQCFQTVEEISDIFIAKH